MRCNSLDEQTVLLSLFGDRALYLSPTGGCTHHPPFCLRLSPANLVPSPPLPLTKWPLHFNFITDDQREVIFNFIRGKEGSLCPLQCFLTCSSAASFSNDDT